MWNGKGFPGTRAGADIPIAARIVQLAEFTEVAHRCGGIPGAVELARRRAEKQFDPHLVEILCADADKVFHDLDETESWDAVLDAEPALSPVLSPAECDEALAAISRFVDLKSPYTIGHSVAVAELVSNVATALGAVLVRDHARATGRVGQPVWLPRRVQRHLGQAPSTLVVGLGTDPAAPVPDRADVAALARACRRRRRRRPASRTARRQRVSPRSHRGHDCTPGTIAGRR